MALYACINSRIATDIHIAPDTGINHGNNH